MLFPVLYLFMNSLAKYMLVSLHHHCTGLYNHYWTFCHIYIVPSITVSSSPNAASGQAKHHSEKCECLLPSPLPSVEVLLRGRRDCSPGTWWLSINPSTRSIFQDCTQDMKTLTLYLLCYMWLCNQNLKTSPGTCVKMQYGMWIILKVKI